ncbi:recombinase family protein, partial [Clostridium akagii]|uniref:recombinase family protein n=1 Tax=Clostridium akagii TaxID=91623 RepID=UPI0005602AF9
MKTAAIYSRKSIYSSKGESLENQIKSCKDYLSRDEFYNFLIYQDEGFSGKNINRPQFKTMLRAARDKKFNILICYRLDRVSRNVSDFSKLIDELNKNGISFISVAEQFDTSKPMGRAMMYIASVFSQLERETIAERVMDNMLELSKSGRWLGGRTPTGFKSTAVTSIDEYLNERTLFKLFPIKEEIEIVQLIYEEYTKKQSLAKVAKYLLQNNFKTRMNNDFSSVTIAGILHSPVYVRATGKVFVFLNKKGIETIGNPDGIHGMLSYNKRKGKTGPYRECDKWIYAMANHEGVVSGSTWLEVQEILHRLQKK